ncbi:hypothetical protein MHLP_00805 [Candidatus Mycoplasma haematolamae str. Purdue]|uniref:Uncharacterized protein n=1 Tax=Mycoplasma haematolamae (strain Purdue) TaxID=1212765 RepID=I7CER6_MYCHA|nr:hypothetical protein [Candidatus Mycoplasma haematolamae]AFO51741.1 hypothetical protein MHLP_00805 [Candidatus Mycoplasma haematolamae str. Purdue]
MNPVLPPKIVGGSLASATLIGGSSYGVYALTTNLNSTGKEAAEDHKESHELLSSSGCTSLACDHVVSCGANSSTTLSCGHKCLKESDYAPYMTPEEVKQHLGGFSELVSKYGPKS